MVLVSSSSYQITCNEWMASSFALLVMTLKNSSLRAPRSGAKQSKDESLSSSYICAGVIVSAHGVKGHMKVKCFLEDPSHFKNYAPFSNENGEVLYQVDKVHSQDKDVLIVSLQGVTDRNQAEGLKGAKLMLSEDRLPALPEDTYYQKDLMGLAVKSLTGKSLGKVHGVHNFGAGDLLEIEKPSKDREMILFTHHSVLEINLQEGTLILSKEGELFLQGGSDVS